MATPARVLLIGSDASDLQARASVLRSFWRVATLALDEQQTPNFDTDLIVLCETVPEADRQTWVDRARMASPGLLIVRLNGYDAGPHAGADATVDADHGPGALVATIYELLTERGLDSRKWAEQSAVPVQ